jgi:hypothetical protein
MAFSTKNHASQLVWTILVGPFLSFFPQRWRDKWFSHHHIAWRPATIISGILQFLFAPLLLLLWTTSEVCSLERSLGFACGGGTTHTFSLVIAAMNPITWLIMYLIFQGVGRAFAAAMLGETPGTLVLAAPDLLYCYFEKQKGRSEAQLPDLVTQDNLRADWQLKIESARPKRDWQAGRLLRYGDHYFRIEACCDSGGPRQSIYLLRKLPMGVPSRSVIIYPQFEAAGQSR